MVVHGRSGFASLAAVAVSFSIWMLLSFVDAGFRLTQTPPNVLYAVTGGTAKFFWDYQLDGGTKLDSQSPIWCLFNPTANFIGYESSFVPGRWIIDKQNCPSRLLRPTVRVHKESKATLVITNVTEADDGLYGFMVVLQSGGPPTVSKSRLVVEDVMPVFTKVPPITLYVQLGQTAKFQWDYVAGNKTTDFDLQSPRWQVYDSKSGWRTIGMDDGTAGWNWKLSSSCPARFLNPTRVSKGSNANLVIYNVTTEDSGLYRCNLTFKDRPSIASTSQLIITVPPHFTTRPPSTQNIKEGQHLTLLCIADGHPKPNVTWVQVKGVTKETITRDEGSATINIRNITKDQTGIYECQAVNNPSQVPVVTQTRINVLYGPAIDLSKSDSTVLSMPGVFTRLRCVVNGFPSPRVTWYKPNGQQVTQNITTWNGVSELSVHLTDSQDLGEYKCGAENLLGYSQNIITVVAYERRTSTIQHKYGSIEYMKDPIVITCVTIIAVLIVVIFIGICFIVKLTRCKGNKNKNSRFSGSAKELSQQGLVNMSEIPPSLPARPSFLDSNNQMPEAEIGLYNTVYEQPVDEVIQRAGPTSSSYPYEIPEPSTEIENNQNYVGRRISGSDKLVSIYEHVVDDRVKNTGPSISSFDYEISEPSTEVENSQSYVDVRISDSEKLGSVYEQPVDDNRVKKTGPNLSRFDYEISEPSRDNLTSEDNMSENGVKTSSSGQYKELNQLDVFTRHYQSLL